MPCRQGQGKVIMSRLLPKHKAESSIPRLGVGVMLCQQINTWKQGVQLPYQ